MAGERSAAGPFPAGLDGRGATTGNFSEAGPPATFEFGWVYGLVIGAVKGLPGIPGVSFDWFTLRGTIASTVHARARITRLAPRKGGAS